jgi:hypothetical protein
MALIKIINDNLNNCKLTIRNIKELKYERVQTENENMKDM